MWWPEYESVVVWWSPGERTWVADRWVAEGASWLDWPALGVPGEYDAGIGRLWAAGGHTDADRAVLAWIFARLAEAGQDASQGSVRRMACSGLYGGYRMYWWRRGGFPAGWRAPPGVSQIWEVRDGAGAAAESLDGQPR